MRTLVILALFPLVLGGCATTAGSVALGVAQQVLAPYSFEVSGEVRGGVWSNSFFLAVDAKVDLKIAFWGPAVAGEMPVQLWGKQFEKGRGQRAYRIVFSGQTGEKFVQLHPVTWEQARNPMSGIPHLPEPEDHAPRFEEAEPPVPVERIKS